MIWKDKATLKEQHALYDLCDHFIKKVYIVENKVEHLKKEKVNILKTLAVQEKLERLLGSQHVSLNEEGIEFDSSMRKDVYKNFFVKGHICVND